MLLRGKMVSRIQFALQTLHTQVAAKNDDQRNNCQQQNVLVLLFAHRQHCKWVISTPLAAHTGAHRFTCGNVNKSGVFAAMTYLKRPSSAFPISSARFNIDNYKLHTKQVDNEYSFFFCFISWLLSSF